MGIALDPAASEFYADGKYKLASDMQLSAGQLIDIYAGWRAKYPLVSIEDGVAEDDWDGWQALTQRLGGSTQLVGDDVFVTNVERIQRGIDANVSNSVLIKLNQIGTVTETINAIHLAQSNGWTAVVSHRSGETVGPRSSPISWWGWAPARSRPAPPPAVSAWRNTTSCCASRKSWATGPSTPAGRCSSTNRQTRPSGAWTAIHAAHAPFLILRCVYRQPARVADTHG